MNDDTTETVPDPVPKDRVGRSGKTSGLKSID